MRPEALAALHHVAFDGVGRAWSAAEFAALLTEGGVFSSISEDGASGFALGRVVAKEAELLTLAVAPAARRQGIGRQVLARFEAEAQARGAAQVFLEVADANRAARQLYATAGYLEQGRRRNYYHPPEGAPQDALLLRRALEA
ncbi:MAG: GNAT family N-acetyltransferase [Pseudomonadota bacterium]